MERVLEEHISTADLVNTRPMPETLRSQPEDGMGPLLPQDFVEDLRSRWDQVQTGFVDEPRVAVQQADELVAQAIKRLAENFATARSQLEGQWDRGDDVSTEELRVALRKYRTFFHRLLAV
jgi:hypothetical protein